jgi:hypothetical protein
MYTGEMRQFLYLLPAEDDFLSAPRMDHFGLEVPSLDELATIVHRAKAYREKDDRVTVMDIDEMVTHGSRSDFTLTNAYVGFLIPLMIEVQHLAERPRA